jgi:hypothetical protein
MRVVAVILLGILLLGCTDNTPDISSVEERKAAAFSELKNELTAPSNGWRVNYKPSPQAGTFLILMKFNEDGTVRVQSDVSANNGEFLDDTISYRIDHDLATELILETYGVFHYLFELNQNNFGAEFEFIYKGPSSNGLLFSSKSDLTNVTTLEFLPAASDDVNLISTTIIDQLASGAYRQGTILGLGSNAIYQFYLPGEDLSLFATFDLGNRRANVYGASLGRTYDEIITNAVGVSVNQLTDIAFVDEAVVFDVPITFSLNGNSHTFSGFSTSNFQQLDTTYCGTDAGTYVTFDGHADGLGSVAISSSLFSSHSQFFDDSVEFYTTSSYYFFDENDSTLNEEIESAFEHGDIFTLISNSTPRGYTEGTFTGLGFAGFDDRNQVQFYLREMEVVQRQGNSLELSLLDGTFITELDSLDERDALFALTDRIFEGGKVYATQVLSIDGLYEVYNPCNQHKFFIYE